MLGNYLAAALRNLIRNRLTAVIGVGGLGIALGAAFLIALFIHDEFSYDRWIPDHARIVRIMSTATFPHTVDVLELAPPSLARTLREEVREVDATVRLARFNPTIGQGDIESLLRCLQVPARSGRSRDGAGRT
jgi:putative ABC transport system permease protein